MMHSTTMQQNLFDSNNGYANQPNGGASIIMSSSSAAMMHSSSSLVDTIRREFSDMYATMTSNVPAGGGGYFQQPSLSVGQTYGRTLFLLFSNLCYYMSASLVTMICLIPLAIVFGKDEPILHPTVTLLFAIYFLLLGRMMMILGTAEYYVGNSMPNILDIMMNQCKVYLFPLFLCTLCIGVPMIFSFELLSYVTGDRLNDVQHVQVHTVRFWFSIILNIALYGLYLYISSYVLLLIVPCTVLEMIESPFAALRRSYELSKSGYHMYLFYGYAVMILFYFVFEVFVEILSGHWFRPAHMNWLDAFFWCIPTFFMIPFLSITETIMYIHIRMQKESLTYEVFQNELRANALSVSSAGSSRRHQQQQQNGGIRYNPVVMMTSDDNITGVPTPNGGYGMPSQQPQPTPQAPQSSSNVGEMNFAYRAPSTMPQQPPV